MATTAERHAAVDADLARLLAIECENKFRNAVWDYWVDGFQIFAFVTPDGSLTEDGEVPSGGLCGCLTMIRRNGAYSAWTLPLTLAIRDDARLPCVHSEITKENLAVFAEWQHRIIDELNPEPATTGSTTTP